MSYACFWIFQNPIRELCKEIEKKKASARKAGFNKKSEAKKRSQLVGSLHEAPAVESTRSYSHADMDRPRAANVSHLDMLAHASPTLAGAEHHCISSETLLHSPLRKEQ